MSEKTGETSIKMGFIDVSDMGEHDSVKKKFELEKKIFCHFLTSEGPQGGQRVAPISRVLR